MKVGFPAVATPEGLFVTRTMKSHLLVLALWSLPSYARAAVGQTGENSAPRIIGRFEPGPIVNGHHRQPTEAEFEARTRDLLLGQQPHLQPDNRSRQNSINPMTD